MDLIMLAALIAWAILVFDNRHHIKHDRWHDE